MYVLPMSITAFYVPITFNFPVHTTISSPGSVIRDSSAVRQLAGAVGRQRTLQGKQRFCRSNSLSAHFHVLWLSDFIFSLKPLNKSLHQSFFYSFITILPSESGVTLDYCMIFP
jgi:hypothetical protein